MEKLEDFFQNNPHYFGLILLLAGLVLLIGVIKDWSWIFQGDGRVFNIEWFSTTFGRKGARVVMGILAVVLVLLGGIWFFLYQ